ncbi:MAG: hypothetical protein JNL21_13945 [Myxococcales bacterium]|nr:hypothetical protein [Myxococcales bacterium]
MSGDEDEVDSGWDDGDEEAPVTRAVDSARLLANFRGSLRESEATTPSSPPGMDAALASASTDGAPISEPPTTRRATDEELKQMRTRAAGSTIRLGGRAPSPPSVDKESGKKTFDPIHSRPTPPAGVFAPKPEAPKPSSSKPSPTVASRSLRLASENLPRKVMAQQRKTTLVSHPAMAEPGARPTSQPPLDLHLDGLDLLGEPETGAAPRSERGLQAEELAERLRAVTSPPPAEPSDTEDLDSLPVDEMLATARSSRPPPEPPARSPSAANAEPTEATRTPLVAPSARLPSLTRPQTKAPPAKATPASPATRANARPTPLVTTQVAAPAPAPSPSEPPAISVVPESIEVEDASLSEAEALAVLSEDDPDLVPIQERFDRGDYFGAALRAEALLERIPDHAAAQRYLESARDALAQMYLGRLGSGEQVLRVAMRSDEIQGLSLDHRSGFLISLIDGVATLDEILDMSGMPQLDALRLLYEMREQGVVVVDSLRL